MHITKNLWNRRSYWLTIAVFETALRYRRKRLGVIWIVVPNLLFVVLVGGLLGRSFTQADNVFLYLYTGLAFWTLSSGIIGASANLYRNNTVMINGAFAPLLEFNVILVLGQLVIFLHHVAVIVIIALITQTAPSADIVYLPLVLIGGLTALFAASVILSCIGVRFADLGEAITGLLRILFLTTPVIWSVDAVGRTDTLGPVLYFNPLFHGIELFRGPIIGHGIEIYHWIPFGVTIVVSCAAALFVCHRFGRKVPLWL